MSILKFYEKHLEKAWFRAVIPGLFAALVFSAKYVEKTWFIVIAGIATFAIPLHTYLISKASEVKLNQVEFWKTELKHHQWLLDVIKGMLLKKMERFRKHTNPVPAEEYKDAVIANLVALREFYSNYAHDPQNHFRITYFKPSNDGLYLITKFYANADGTPPVSHNDIETQKIRFNKDTSTTEAVKAWRNREVCIAEKESDIPYLYNQQKSKYKSIIAYPIFENNDCAKQVIGVISVTSSRNAFFIMQDIDRHKNYIEQFALRLVFEYCKLQSNNNANPA